MTTERERFISALVGKPWKANAKGPDEFDCWHLAQFIHRNLYQNVLPDVEVPPHVGWKWMIMQFTTHPEIQNWVERLQGQIVKAKDGSIVLMGHNKSPAHCGVWLAHERKIIHCSQDFGVIKQTVAELKACGWSRLKFYEQHA